jgi:hypothetical protein
MKLFHLRSRLLDFTGIASYERRRVQRHLLDSERSRAY